MCRTCKVFFFLLIRSIVVVVVVVFFVFVGGRSIQPKFPEISVQNSMVGSVQQEKFRKQLVHLSRWTTFPGRTGLDFGWMDRARCFHRFFSNITRLYIFFEETIILKRASLSALAKFIYYSKYIVCRIRPFLQLSWFFWCYSICQLFSAVDTEFGALQWLVLIQGCCPFFLINSYFLNWLPYVPAYQND